MVEVSIETVHGEVVVIGTFSLHSSVFPRSAPAVC